MVRIAVCDDNPPVAEQIRQIWETKAGEFWKEIRTEVFYDAESLIRADREEAFDIYVLDICMQGGAYGSAFFGAAVLAAAILYPGQSPCGGWIEERAVCPAGGA